MSLYDLTTKTLDGKSTDLSQFRGKVTLAVNVASECGFTPQYAGLQSLHDDLAARGFSVLGFPSNEFGGQEPGTAEQIHAFCELNYGVKFPMFAKLATKPGPDQSPVYALPDERAARRRTGTSASFWSARMARCVASSRATSPPAMAAEGHRRRAVGVDPRRAARSSRRSACSHTKTPRPRHAVASRPRSSWSKVWARACGTVRGASTSTSSRAGPSTVSATAIR